MPTPLEVEVARARHPDAAKYAVKRGAGSEFDFTTLPLKPATRESCLAAIRGSGTFAFVDKKLSKDPANTAAAIADTFERGEWFDFGEIDADDLATAATDALPFFRSGLLKPPYPLCILRVRLSDREEGKAVELVIVVGERERPDGPDSQMGTVVMSMRQNGLQREYISLLSAVVLNGTTTFSVGDERSSRVAMWEYLGLWIILNARGVPKVVEEPSEKLNRARSRSGKPPLKRVTRVDSTTYVRALGETKRMEGSGDRTSPRTHLRRGHLHHYRSTRFSRLEPGEDIMVDADGVKCRWIPPLIVNGTDPAGRTEYRVRAK